MFKEWLLPSKLCKNLRIAPKSNITGGEGALQWEPSANRRIPMISVLSASSAMRSTRGSVARSTQLLGLALQFLQVLQLLLGLIHHPKMLSQAPQKKQMDRELVEFLLLRLPPQHFLRTLWSRHKVLLFQQIATRGTSARHVRRSSLIFVKVA